jgi:hypothetical protein
VCVTWEPVASMWAVFEPPKGAVQVEDPQGPEYRCEAQGRINS